MKVIIGKSQSDTLVIGETYSYSDSTNIFDGTEVSYILAYFSRNKMPNPNLIELRKESRETEKGEEITDDIKEQVYQFIKDNGINKVICFGRPAFAALFNSIARGQLISKLANKMLSECSEVPGVKASVIEYPYGYLLKEPDDIESYISGIGDVFRKSQPFEITNQEVTEDELIRWLEETDSGSYSRIGMDYETNAENQFSYKFKTTIIGFSRLAAPSIMLGSTVKAEGIWYRVPDSGLSDKLWDVLKNFLDNNYQKIWAYNCPFEIKVSKRLFGEFYEFQDTMVLMTMFDKRGSLKNVARSELGVSLWDTTVKQFLDLAETIFKRYDKKKSLTLEEKIELVKEDTEINSLISEIYWDNDEFIRLLEANWGSPWGSVPRDVLGPYCADDASYTIILAEQNDKDWMKQAYDFHIPNAYLDALFEINGTTWDETEADYQIDDLTKKAIKCLSSLILLMPRLQEFHEEPIRLKVNNILSKQLPYENVYYTPKQKKEKRVLITDELGRLGDLVAIFNPNSNTNDNRALFWDTYFTDELKKATFLELVLEEMQLKQKRHELHEKIFDMTEFKKGVKPSEILNRISVYLKEHKDDPFTRELMAAGNKAGDNLPEFSNKFASDVIKLQYKVHVTYFGLDISDESTWSNEFKMLYYIFLYKKYMKVISANINGAAGRALVSEDLGKDKFGNIIRGDNVMDISDKTDKKFILDFEFNPMSAASLRWTSSAHCLTGDTKVKLSGGEVDTVENIFERVKAGETLKSYSVNEETLEMHEQEIRDVVLNAYTDELIELELDNGDIIRCTPNHRFMLNSGLYKAAESLCLTDRLMVFEKGTALVGKKLIKADYPLPVYDLVMKSADSPNFTIESGIISHNSQPAGSPFRRILKAPEDKINVHFDISQNELCVVAFLANEQTMLEGFKQGYDMHRYMASHIYDKPVEEITGEERRATKACLTGDMKVKLLSGELVEMKDLGNYIGQWTYGLSETGKAMPAQIEWHEETKRVDEYIEIEFDNGVIFKCTPDHEIILDTGAMIPANKLTVDDNVAEFYSRISTEEDYLVGYEVLEMVGEPGFTHHKVAKYFDLSRDEESLENEKEILNIHHIDGNRLNNDISNLELLTKSEHTKLHHIQGEIPNMRNHIDYKYVSKMMKEENSKDWEDTRSFTGTNKLVATVIASVREIENGNFSPELYEKWRYRQFPKWETVESMLDLDLIYEYARAIKKKDFIDLKALKEKEVATDKAAGERLKLRYKTDEVFTRRHRAWVSENMRKLNQREDIEELRIAGQRTRVLNAISRWIESGDYNSQEDYSSLSLLEFVKKVVDTTEGVTLYSISLTRILNYFPDHSVQALIDLVLKKES